MVEDIQEKYFRNVGKHRNLMFRILIVMSIIINLCSCNKNLLPLEKKCSI